MPLFTARATPGGCVDCLLLGQVFDDRGGNLGDAATDDEKGWKEVQS